MKLIQIEVEILTYIKQYINEEVKCDDKVRGRPIITDICIFLYNNTRPKKS